MKSDSSTNEADLMLAEYGDAEELLGIDAEGNLFMQLLRINTKTIEAAKQKVSHAIQHLSYAELSEIANLMREHHFDFQIITRTILEQTLTLHNATRITTAAQLLDREGPQETMLYLLGVFHYMPSTLKPISTLQRTGTPPIKKLP